MSVRFASSGASPPAGGYARRLGLFSGTMVVVGGIIGAGIFLNPAIVAQRVVSPELVLLGWALGGLVALIGAFVWAELAALRPRAGGGYVYLREAFGPLPAFLYAWALLLVIATGAIAAVAVTFARYACSLFALPNSAAVPLAVGAIVALSAVNFLGVKPGAVTQNVFTLLKLAALAGLVVAGLAFSGQAAPGGTVPEASAGPAGAKGVALAMGAALVPILFAYGGWQQANFIAEEVIEPERNLPRALLLGVATVVAVYLLANVTYLKVLTAAGLAASPAPATDTMRRVLGPAGATLMSAGIAVSTFGFLNLVILVSPRVYQAMAADGLFFPRLARLHARYRTPGGAIVFQALWAVLLAVSGTYGDLLDYVVFGDWIFFGLVAATLFVYRARAAGSRSVAVQGTTYRAWGHPWTSAIFLAAAVYVVASVVITNPANALRGAALLALGVPVYGYWRRRSG